MFDPEGGRRHQQDRGGLLFRPVKSEKRADALVAGKGDRDEGLVGKYRQKKNAHPKTEGARKDRGTGESSRLEKGHHPT